MAVINSEVRIQKSMLLTYKVRHERDFSEELRKAKQVANFGVRYRTLSSKDVRHIGLKSIIANQILRKYGRNHNIKKAWNVNLIVPGQGIKTDKERRTITMSCLKLSLSYWRLPDFEKVNQVDVDNEYAYVCISVAEKALVESGGMLALTLTPPVTWLWCLTRRRVRCGSSESRLSTSTRSIWASAVGFRSMESTESSSGSGIGRAAS